MPAVKGKSSLFARIGDKMKKAVKEHAHDETKLGFVDLPGGLLGVARLTKLYFKEYDKDVKDAKLKGQVYLRGEGTIVEVQKGPANVVGLTTKVGPIPICDSGKGERAKALAENVATMLNEFRKLGSDPDTLLAAADDLSILEQEAKDLVEAGPYFRFKTEEGKATAEYPTPRVFENWLSVRGLEEYVPGNGEAVQDDTAVSEEGPADVVEEEAAADEEPPTEEASEEPAGDDVDLDALAKMADPPKRDKASAKQLAEIAAGTGVSEESVGNADSWAEVVEMIRSAQAGDSNTAEEPEVEPEPEETPYEPTVRDTVKYKRPGAKKAEEFDVTAVYKKAQKVDLKDTDTGKIIVKGVAWDKLIVD